MNYGIGLMQIRESLKLSTTEFAEKCGITPGDVFKFEENCEKITKKEAEDICEKINVPIQLYVFLCMEREDVKNENKLHMYDMISEPIKSLIIEILGMNENDTVDGEKVQDLIDSLKSILGE